MLLGLTISWQLSSHLGPWHPLLSGSSLSNPLQRCFSIIFSPALGLIPGTSNSITSPNNPSPSRPWPNHLILPYLTTVNCFTPYLLATSSLVTRSARVTPVMYRSILLSHAWIRSALFLVMLHVSDPYSWTDPMQALYIAPLLWIGTCLLVKSQLISFHFFHAAAVQTVTAPSSQLNMWP